MKSRVLVFVILAQALVGIPGMAQSASDLFQQALVKERTDGDLKAAIDLYERVISVSTDRSLTARALVQLGKSYELLGLTEASAAYQRVVDDYSEQRDAVRVAQDRLTELLVATAEKKPKQIESGVLKRHVMDIPDDMGEVSPDGRYLSFVDWNSANVAILNLETGEKTFVTSDGYWSDNSSAFGDTSIWSSDGKDLMYLWYSDQGPEIRIYNTITGETRILIPAGAERLPYPVVWTKDGSQYLAINERDDHVTDAITLVDTEDGATKVISTLAGNLHTFGMDISPDEKHIVMESFREGARQNAGDPVSLKIMASDGSGEKTLVDDGQRNYSPAWNIDGSNVLYMALGDDRVELRAIPVDNGQVSGDPRIVYSEFEGNVIPMGIASDGRYFYVQKMREHNVFEQGVNLETGAMHQNLRVISSVKLGNQRSGAISPNGEFLAFVSEKLGEALLVITHQVSGDTKTHEFSEYGRIQLPPTQSLKWSPDNTSILVQALDRSEQPVRPVFLSVNVNDGSYVKMSGFEDFGLGSIGAVKGSGYSDDGKKVIFAAAMHLVEVDIAHKTKRIIHEYSEHEIVGMSVSPNGQTAALTLNSVSPTDGDKATIEVISLKDGTRSNVDEASTGMGYSQWVEISWTPDGKGLLFAENRPNSGQQLYAINLESGQRTAIGNPVFEDDQYFGVRVHPDGDKLSFSRGGEKIQLWVLEGIEL